MPCSPVSSFLSRSEAVPASNVPPVALSGAAARSSSVSSSSLCVHTSEFAVITAIPVTTRAQPRDVYTDEPKSERPALLRCAVTGDVCGIEALITAGVDVNMADEVGLSAVMYAAVCGHSNIAQALLCARATITVISEGIAALVKRVSTAELHVDVIGALLCVNSQLREGDDDTRGEEGEPRDMEKPVDGEGEENGVGSDEEREEYGKEHIDVEADEDYDNWEWTDLQNVVLDDPLLIWAAKSGYVDVVKLLLAAGADVYERCHDNEKNKNKTALHVAAVEGNVAITALLLAAGDAVYLDATAAICTALGWSDDWTALHLAAQSGHVAVMEMLLVGGADVHARNTNGETALHLAAEAGHGGAVEVLLAAGVNVDARDNDGWSALHNASRHDHVGVVKALLAADADIRTTDNDGWSALHIASHAGKTDVVSVLVSARAHLHSKANDGRTALHLASQQGKVDIIELLLDVMASVHAVTTRDG